MGKAEIQATENIFIVENMLNKRSIHVFVNSCNHLYEVYFQ